MMVWLGWILRALVALIILRFVLRALFGDRRTRARQAPPRKRVERAGGTLVQDPQCGTYIPQVRAVSVGRGDRALHFCSTTCRDQYLAARGQRHAS
jgi:hypothetical protein